MASINIPSMRRTETSFELPNKFGVTSDPLAIARGCNALLDGYTELIATLPTDVRKHLLNGKIPQRVWAYYQVREAAERAYKQQNEVEYVQKLKAAVLEALDHPLTPYIHHSLQASLNPDTVAVGMPDGTRKGILDALWAIANLEADTEDPEVSTGFPHAPKRSSKRRKAPRGQQVAA